jgi:hypothetical protein
MRKLFLLLSMLSFPFGSTVAQVSVQIGLPAVAIGIAQPVYPRLIQIPGYPVYYAPGGHSNYFFYDGMYWAFQGDGWYASSWYDGPWAPVAPHAVPALLPGSPRVLSRLGSGRASALGEPLGQRLGTAASGLGQMGPQERADAGATPRLPEGLRGCPLPSRGAPAVPAHAELSP